MQWTTDCLTDRLENGGLMLMKQKNVNKDSLKGDW